MKLHQDIKRLADQVEQIGWRPEYMTGGDHIVFVHAETDEKVTVANTPSDWRGIKNSIALMERKCGQRIPKQVSRKSRKAVRPTDFDVEKASRENDQYRERWGDRIDQLVSEHGELVSEFRELHAAGEKATRTQINRALEIIRRIEQIETAMAEFHQPINKFNPIHP